MQIKTAVLIILVLFVFFSCKKEGVVIAEQEAHNLEGYWVNRQISDTLHTFQRSAGLEVNQYGIALMSGGKLTERKNAGWCGTPPIVYSDFGGRWSINDSIINITVGYWGGTATFSWQIISVDDERLAIEVISEVYSQEN